MPACRPYSDTTCLQNFNFFFTQVAYTYDAGPNACLFMLEDTVSEMASLALHYFPSSNGQLEVKGIKFENKLNQVRGVSNFYH